MIRQYIGIFLFIVSIYAPQWSWAQGTKITLKNPSFEQAPQASTTPMGWNNCGFIDETDPDIQPNSAFRVIQSAYDGSTYLGMVTRDNDTWEAISQKLNTPLQKGKCYSVSIALSRSEYYISISHVTARETNYTTPIKLRVWGGNSYCNKAQLLSESPIINHNVWKEYTFKLQPNQNYNYIILEAYYKQPSLVAYCGNILVDKVSDITLLGDCNKVVPPVKELPKVTPPIAQVPKPIKKPPVKKPPKVTPPVVVKEDKTGIIAEMSKNMKTGKSIRIDQLNFEADSTRIKPNAFNVLDDISYFLNTHKGLVIEIAGHTNSIPTDDYCDRISEERAKSVADYLTNKGIPKSQVRYKGYGKRKPLASDSTYEGRQKNQRVEITILSE